MNDKALNDDFATLEASVSGFTEGEAALEEVDRMFSALSQAVKAAYRKHVLDDPRIGWDELHTILADAIVSEMGDVGFCQWLERAEAEMSTQTEQTQA